MSIPPQLIKIKRKRDDDTPVTFLQFDDGAKRHRSDSNWVYQRRLAVPIPQTFTSPREARPIIHVASDAATPSKKRSAAAVNNATESAQPTAANGPGASESSRKFHISRAMLKNEAASRALPPGVLKRPRQGPAIFVERTRKKIAAQKAVGHRSVSSTTQLPLPIREKDSAAGPPQQSEKDALPESKTLKRPSAAKRTVEKPRTPLPLPDSHANTVNQDIDKIAKELDQWFINEVGANLEAMDQEPRPVSSPKFRPKVPSQRFRDRHPEASGTFQSTPPASQTEAVDAWDGSEDDEEDGDDWIIEEYVRIPAKAMAVDVSPTDVGVLVLDGDEATALFYGPENDSDDEYPEDDEDENAENHYTADYPEDEVASDDEYGRQAYMYRNRNASDDEEYDNEGYASSDDMVLDGDGDDDATMARIKAYMKRQAARG